MKLRQKLAIVLASAMIVTAVPVTTMAASTNSLSKTIAITGNYTITSDHQLDLIVDYTREVKEGDVFYLVAQDFTFDTDYYTANSKEGTGYEITSIKDKELEITVAKVTDEDAKGISELKIPVVGTVADKGTPAIKIDAVNSYATAETVLLGGEVTTAKTLVAKADSVESIVVDEAGVITLGDIKIEEKVAAQLAGTEITLTLPRRSQLEFVVEEVDDKGVKNPVQVELKGTRGIGEKDVVVEYVDKEDTKAIKFTIPESLKGVRPSDLTISGIKVKNEAPRKDLPVGDVTVTVTAEKLDRTNLVLGKVVEQSFNAVIVDADKVEDIVAGGDAVKVKVKLTQKGDVVRRPVYITVDGAYIATDATGATEAKEQEIEVTVGENGEEVVELFLAADAGKTGDVVVTVDGRSLDKAIELDVTEVVAPFEVKTEKFVFEPGVRGQKGGKIVISEKEEGSFERTQEFVFTTDSDDLTITKAAVETTGDLEASVKVEAGKIIVTVNRSSYEEAGDIIIKDIELTSKGYLAQGEYDLKLTGTGVGRGEITLEGFLTTENAKKTVEIGVGEDVYLDANNRMMAKLRTVSEAFGVEPSFGRDAEGRGVITFFKDGKVVQFINGTNIMNLNGVSIPMDTQTVIKEDNYTYVPARFLAEALGLNVEWNATAKVATFTTK